MSSASLEDLLVRGVAAVRQAAAFALDPGEELRIEAKAHRNDLVTQVDRGVEEHIAHHLETTGIPLHGEEAHHIEDFEAYRGRAWVRVQTTKAKKARHSQAAQRSPGRRKALARCSSGRRVRNRR